MRFDRCNRALDARDGDGPAYDFSRCLMIRMPQASLPRVSPGDHCVRFYFSDDAANAVDRVSAVLDASVGKVEEANFTIQDSSYAFSVLHPRGANFLGTERTQGFRHLTPRKKQHDNSDAQRAMRCDRTR